MLRKGGAFPVSGKSGRSEAKPFGQQWVAAPESKNIQGSESSKVEAIKCSSKATSLKVTEITNAEKSLVLIRATIQGESLKWGHVGRRLKVFTLSETTKAEVYNSICHPINSESVPETKVAQNNSRHEQSARADARLSFRLGFGGRKSWWSFQGHS